MIKKYKYVIIIAIIIFIIFQNFSFKEDTKELSNTKKVVSVSTFVLYDVAKNIAGDTFKLVRIIPSGVDIHAYEPTPKIMAKVEKSDLLIYNGAGLEPWLTAFSYKGKAIAMAKYVQLKHLDSSEDKHHDHKGCSHSSFDPHIWFDIVNMKRITEILTYEFIMMEPENKSLYIANRNKYIKMLDKLNSSYEVRLESCKLDTIITNHNAFTYLADNYGFKISSLKGLSPDSESSPKDIIRIIKAIKETDAPIIFFENFSSNKSMKSLATQADVKIDSLHTLGNTSKDDMKMQLTYEDIMLQNLAKISEALICQ